MSEKTRTEKDPLGTLEVPSDALYGVQTLRAVQNFPISSLRPLPAFVDATIRIKRAAALTHKQRDDSKRSLRTQSSKQLTKFCQASTASTSSSTSIRRAPVP